MSIKSQNYVGLQSFTIEQVFLLFLCLKVVRSNIHFKLNKKKSNDHMGFVLFYRKMHENGEIGTC